MQKSSPETYENTKLNEKEVIKEDFIIRKVKTDLNL